MWSTYDKVKGAIVRLKNKYVFCVKDVGNEEGELGIQGQKMLEEILEAYE